MCNLEGWEGWSSIITLEPSFANRAAVRCIICNQWGLDAPAAAFSAVVAAVVVAALAGALSGALAGALADVAISS